MMATTRYIIIMILVSQSSSHVREFCLILNTSICILFLRICIWFARHRLSSSRWPSSSMNLQEQFPAADVQMIRSSRSQIGAAIAHSAIWHWSDTWLYLRRGTLGSPRSGGNRVGYDGCMWRVVGGHATPQVLTSLAHQHWRVIGGGVLVCAA